MRKFAWGVLIYSGLMSFINWPTSWWGGATALQAVFGDDLLTPIFLYPSLLVLGLVLDAVAVGLTMGVAPKAKRKPNLLVCAAALFVLVAPVVANSIYTGQ